MNVTVANRHWATAGGGEDYALAIARSLAERGADVALLGPPSTDWDALAQRFGVQADPRVVDFDDEAAVARAGAGSDLFVNAGHATQLPNPGRRGLLVVHFPRDHGIGLGRAQRMLLRRLVRRGWTRNSAVVWAKGFYASGEVGRLLRWTDGRGTIVFDPSPPPGTPVTVTFGTDRPTPTGVEVRIGSELAPSEVVPHERRSVTVRVGPDDPTLIEIGSDVFVPAEAWDGVSDERPHGVPVVDVTVGSSLAGRCLDRLEAWRRSELLGYVSTYDTLLCHSSYTARWVEHWWGVAPAVVEPPVEPRPPGEKESVVLAVGRFFDPHRGHSKRQLELVGAFRDLSEGGATGWRLHLVGRCDPEDAAYLDQVRSAAAGLPVDIHLDADRRELDELYAQASIFWHAAGLDVDPEGDPEGHEHFGIAVVEAMTAGAVPIVHGTGGPVDIVSDGVDGLHFDSIGELVEHTRRLIDDPDRRERLARAARDRARDFTFERFDDRLARVVEVL